MMRRHINSGAPAELLTAQRLVELGYIVSFPFFAKASYDLIADTGLSLVRIQVKTIYYGKTDNGQRWMMDFLKPRGMTYKVEKYSEKDCDYIVGACPIHNACYVFPIELVKERRGATFYFDEQPHPNARNTGWADQFKEMWF
ncbi:TPA: group I intron-associated PD-(D/E)XK endonuclease [Legionella anisa]|uniref:group I intron-associated PD-(D/E)XK endonuclease n=1 Tax=Legionella anisa TaxID=28082 RepID=UPI0022434BDD|nr:group I intron-associated PD-(D/E)XK endonuclease [Legionella anisa]MCW8425610.1 group I intron-associated PD-(D/E)XK endonuclease [Legionella anisa]MCW8448961.1 group I intron-associated PD-(D/E)XK endonuclease [Legionella anisa]